MWSHCLKVRALFAVAGLLGAARGAQPPAELPRLAANNPGLLADLGVGLWAWPLPMDFNGDGMMDLVVVCTGVPSNGIWYFENSGQIDPVTGLSVFKAGSYLGSARSERPRLDAQVSFVDGQAVVTTPGMLHPEFKTAGFGRGIKLVADPEIKPGPGSVRTRQWRLVDYDGDGATDLVVGVHYGGDHGRANNYDAAGAWKGGPLRGYVYVLRNTGSDVAPRYGEPERIVTAEGAPVDVYGLPSPSFADFRRSGKLDLICGEFLDGFTFFENIGTRTSPRYAAGRRLIVGGKPLRMDLCMITPVAVDFNGDGHVDLVVGDEDGRVALIENTGEVVDRLPQFLPPRYFRQLAADLKFGALAAPVSFDWDGDGLDDLIVGNSAGHVGFIKNLGGVPPRWAAPVYLSAGGKMIREQAGSNGSLQGPSEAKWGYTNPSVADWDGDGLPDLITNGVWGRVLWHRNIGSRTAPRLGSAQPLQVSEGGAASKPAWNWWNPAGSDLVTQWRTTPCVIDWNGDGLPDLVMLDAEGFLAFFERRRTPNGALELGAPQRVFWAEGESAFDSHGLARNEVSGLLQLNDAGKDNPGRSGRRTFCFHDWDGDGILDLIVNSQPGVNWLRGTGRNAAGLWSFRHEGPLSAHVIAGHSTTPTMVDWDKDGIHDLLVGAEDGFFYLLKNTRWSPR